MPTREERRSAGEKHTCQKCGKTMTLDGFYLNRDGTVCDLCKQCLAMHIDNFDESTYVWILKKLDFPYIPEVWNSWRDRTYARNGKLTTTSVLGRYLSTMRLSNWNRFGWNDSEEARRVYASQNGTTKTTDPEYAAEMRQKFDSGEISEAEYRTLVDTESQVKDDETEKEERGETPPVVPEAETAYYHEDNFMQEADLPDITKDLTDDDKVYLAMKWGLPYKATEWVQLEQKYTEMAESFDIQDADTEDTLKLICKVYLKMNQAVDSGDMQSFQKLSSAYDTLRKSAKFTAAQNKELQSDYVDSVGELVAMCEREGGFIPRYATNISQDKVDETLKDMNNYIYKLVTQDLGFGQQIDDALRKIQIQKEMDEAADAMDDDDSSTLEDMDMEDYYNEIDSQRDQDYAIEEGYDDD